MVTDERSLNSCVSSHHWDGATRAAHTHKLKGALVVHSKETEDGGRADDTLLLAMCQCRPWTVAGARGRTVRGRRGDEPEFSLSHQSFSHDIWEEGEENVLF